MIQRIPLHYAVRNNSYKSVKLLVERTREIDSVDSEGKTALDIAAEYNRLSIIELLMNKGLFPFRNQLQQLTKVYINGSCTDSIF